MDTNNFAIHEDYRGSRNILVPAKMYSRNMVLGALHLKSDRYLCVDLDRYILTFYKDKAVVDRDPKCEIPFSHITGLDADVTSADKQKYYLTVFTVDGDLKFKFASAADFHTVVDALRNTINQKNNKPVLMPNDAVLRSREGYVGVTGNDVATRIPEKTYGEDRSGADFEKYRLEKVNKDDKDSKRLYKEREEDLKEAYKATDRDIKSTIKDVRSNVRDTEKIADNRKEEIKQNYERQDEMLKAQRDALKDDYKDAKKAAPSSDVKDQIKAEYKAQDHYLKTTRENLQDESKRVIRAEENAKDREIDNIKAQEEILKKDREIVKDNYEQSKDLLDDAYKHGVNPTYRS